MQADDVSGFNASYTNKTDKAERGNFGAVAGATVLEIHWESKADLRNKGKLISAMNLAIGRHSPGMSVAVVRGDGRQSIAQSRLIRD
jgi:hypothetical protein